MSKEIEDMKDLCRFELDEAQGSFAVTILKAFLYADKDNSELMLPLMKELQKKYHLKKGRS